jgi:hypothetical protein
MSNIFKEVCEDVAGELNLSPAQLVDSINKWTEINLRLQQRIEEMKSEHIAELKQKEFVPPTEEEFVDQVEGEFLRSAEQAGKDRY